ncbi:MAG: hypothetical protein J0H17_03865 [Rhizobiales bacterium]|nr:hypothetical protein [Hyphomicrobiales bacterium]
MTAMGWRSGEAYDKAERERQEAMSPAQARAYRREQAVRIVLFAAAVLMVLAVAVLTR